MITTEMILSLGWEHQATSGDGGTKTFVKIQLDQKAIYNLQSSADNFIKSDEEKKVIKIKKMINFTKMEDIYEGIPNDLDDLKRILVKTGADLTWMDEIRDKKIDEICQSGI